jgi:hypothetical protein
MNSVENVIIEEDQGGPQEEKQGAPKKARWRHAEPRNICLTELTRELVSKLGRQY